jgi:hypothetical protein
LWRKKTNRVNVLVLVNVARLLADVSRGTNTLELLIRKLEEFGCWLGGKSRTIVLSCIVFELPVYGVSLNIRSCQGKMCILVTGVLYHLSVRIEVRLTIHWGLVYFLSGTYFRINVFLHVAVAVKVPLGLGAAGELRELVAVPLLGGLDATNIVIHFCRYEMKCRPTTKQRCNQSCKNKYVGVSKMLKGMRKIEEGRGYGLEEGRGYGWMKRNSQADEAVEADWLSLQQPNNPLDDAFKRSTRVVVQMLCYCGNLT